MTMELLPGGPGAKASSTSLSVMLSEGAKILGLSLTPREIDKFNLYLKELALWNKKISLTAVTEEKEIIIKHFLDSLTVSSLISPHMRAIDVGTGAGFPGIPLKIVRPDMRLTLLESVQKKVKFLEHLVSVLGLKEVEVIWGRAEDLGRKENYRELFDLSVSRAVADLNVLAEYSLPFVKIGGLFVAQKEEKIEEELTRAEKAISILGGKLKELVKIKLPFSEITRSLVVIEKVSSTPEKYPRRPGMPKKKPLS